MTIIYIVEDEDAEGGTVAFETIREARKSGGRIRKVKVTTRGSQRSRACALYNRQQYADEQEWVT